MKSRIAIGCTLLLMLAAPATWAAKVQICHVPPDNPANFHTITVNDNALQAHLAHGDLLGRCFEHCDQLCDDGNACTIDACDAAEHCKSDHPPVSCDDGNLCTIDSCDPAGGCSSNPRTCVDNSLCTVDACDPLTGECVFPSATCPTGQICNPANGVCQTEDDDPCASDPCAHGICNNSDGSYTCTCPPGWTGHNCDVNIDDCQPNPCVNGTCTDLVDDHICACNSGWTGRNCEIPDQAPTYNCTDRSPCTAENAAAGLFYFSADSPAQFIQCSEWGQCYTMSCPSGTSWNQDALTCN